MSNRSRARILTGHILSRHSVVLTRVAFSSIREIELERAEKRFLFNFLLSLVGSSVVLAAEFNGLDMARILLLPLRDLLLILLMVAILISSVLSLMAYLSIGLKVVVERSVQIKPKRDD